MTAPSFPKAAPNFTDPLGLLRACHERIFSHCNILHRLVSHLRTQGADDEALEAMSRIHRYFSTSAQHHHQDEEQDLFPRLRARSAELDDFLAQLETDHETLVEHWRTLADWLTDPSRAAAQADAFAAIVDRFTEAYRSHAMKENDVLFHRAATLLRAEDLRDIGAAMARRRQVSEHSQ